MEPGAGLEVPGVELFTLAFGTGWIGMVRRAAIPSLALGVVLGLPGLAAAQEVPDFLPVGQTAPDIQVTGATRYGVVSEPVKLSDFRGETVILAFFFRARSGG